LSGEKQGILVAMLTLSDFLGHELEVGLGDEHFARYRAKLLSWNDYGVVLKLGENLEFRTWRFVWFIRKAQG
jgi:hypothetical protein